MNEAQNVGAYMRDLEALGATFPRGWEVDRPKMQIAKLSALLYKLTGRNA